MPRILSIDIGKKRTGLAVTDPLKIIATGLATIATRELIPFLKKYTQEEDVELFLVGEPKNLDDSDTDATPLVRQSIALLKKHFPKMAVRTIDERYSSKRASESFLKSGLKKKKRRNKALIDETSAVILLQDYLQSI